MKYDARWGLLILTVGISLSVGSDVEATCGTGAAAKYHASIVWDGVNWLPSGNTFDDTVRNANKRMGPVVRKQFLALGGSIGAGKDKNKFEPAWRPSTLGEGTEVVEASIEGLTEIAQKITHDVAALRKSDLKFDPSDYQLTFVVTNHGTVLTGKNGKEYGIAASPLAKSSHHSDFGTPFISMDELRAFTKTLPRGIRVKAIFGQCFGSDAMRAALEGLPDRDLRCNCGTAHASPGEPSASEIGRDADAWIDQVVNRAYSEGRSLQAITYTTRSTFGNDLNEPATLTSENLVYDYFSRNAVEFGLSAEATVTDMNRAAGKILRQILSHSQKALGAEDRKWLETEMMARVRAYRDRLPWVKEEEIRKGDEILDMGEEWSIRRRHYLQIPFLKFFSDSDYSPDPYLHFFEVEGARRALMKAFMLTASVTQKKNLYDLLACEQDPVGTQDVPHATVIVHWTKCPAGTEPAREPCVAPGSSFATRLKVFAY